MSDICIRRARKDDALMIARFIAMAIGDEEIMRSYCGADYLAVLAEIVRTEDAQYSYRHTLVAESAGSVVGAAIGYDGALLPILRERTFAVIREKTGIVPVVADETSAGEFYLDTLAVLPEYQGLGIGRSLLAAMRDSAFSEGYMCVGLLVDFSNPRAESLYLSLGFKRVDTKLFFGHNMYHLQALKSD